MAGRNKKQLASDEKVQQDWTRLVVNNDKVDPREELSWESLWHGFVIGKGRPELATYTHYMRLGFPSAMSRPKVAAQAATDYADQAAAEIPEPVE